MDRRSKTQPSDQSRVGDLWPNDLRIVVKWLMVVVACGYVALLAKYLKDYNGVFTSTGSVLGGDFVNYWSAAQLAKTGDILPLFDDRLYHEIQINLLHHPFSDLYNWLYPPYFLPLILWLSLFSYGTALLLWVGVTFGAYAVACAYKEREPWPFAFALFLAPSSLENINFFQNGFLSAALLVGGVRLLRLRPIFAGILFGCLSYKPQLAFLIPLALITGRHGRALISMTLTLGVLSLIATSRFGIMPWDLYFENIVSKTQTVLAVDRGAYAKALTMMPTLFVMARVWGLGAVGGYIISGAAICVACAATIYTFRVTKGAHQQLTVLATATLLATPYLFIYDLPMLTAAAAAFVISLRRNLGTGELVTVTFALVGPFLVAVVNPLGIPVIPAAAGLLLALQLRQIRHDGRDISGR